MGGGFFKTPTMQVHGLRTITQSIYLKAGKTQYNLTRDHFLGLPKSAKILAITSRLPDRNTSNENGQALSRAWYAALLTVKAKGSTTIIDNVPLPEMQFNTAVPFGVHFWSPTRNDKVDWLNSYIAIQDSSLIKEGEAIEYTVYYTCEDAYSPQGGSQEYFGAKFRGTRSSVLAVPIDSVRREYKLYFDSNFAIPQDSYIVGLQVCVNGYTDDKKPIANVNARNNAFLYIKKRTRDIISGLPLNLRVNPGFGVPYFPIEPILVSEFDATDSKITVGDQSQLVPGEAFLIILYYTCED